MLDLLELDAPEKSRTYYYADGSTQAYENVTHFLARSSGTHRLRTADGLLHIVAPGWRSISIDAEKFSL